MNNNHLALINLFNFAILLFLYNKYVPVFKIGLAVGFFVPPNIVRNSNLTMDIGKDLSLLFYGGAGYMTLIFILIVICKFSI